LASPLCEESTAASGSCSGDLSIPSSEGSVPGHPGNPSESQSWETEIPHRYSPERRPVLGYLLALAAAVIWGTLGIFTSLIYRYRIDPVVLVTARGVIACSPLLVILTLLCNLRHSLYKHKIRVSTFNKRGLVSCKSATIDLHSPT